MLARLRWLTEFVNGLALADYAREALTEGLACDPTSAGHWAGELRLVLGELVRSSGESGEDVQIAHRYFTDAMTWVSVKLSNITIPVSDANRLNGSRPSMSCMVIRVAMGRTSIFSSPL
jgi:hypothetical protein